MALTLVGSIAGNAAAGPTASAVASPTTTTVTSSRNPSVRGESLTLTATVRKSGTTVPATGLVTFSMDGATIVPGVPLLAGVATTNLASLSLGSHTISVTYGGSGATYLGSSGSLTLTVSKADATATVTSTANPAVYGQELVLTATVKPVRPGGGTPSGTVDWMIGSTPASGTLANGKAELRLPLAAGRYPVTATYRGDASFNQAASGPLTQAVSKAATTLTLSSSQNPSPYNEPPRIAVTVTPVSPAAGTPTGTVTLELAGKTFDVTLADGKATYAFANYTPGSQTVDAAYLGDANFAGSDADTLAQSVGKSQPPALTVSMPVDPAILGDPLSLTLRLTPPTGVGARPPTGSVTLDPFDAESATKTLSSSATVTFSTTAGTNPSGKYTATYTGDANYSGGALPAFTVAFRKRRTAVALGASPKTATVGDSVTLSATVSGLDGEIGAGTGTVTFTEGDRALGRPVALAGGEAGIVVKALDPGRHTFRAAFSGVGNVGGSDDTIDVVVTATDGSPAKPSAQAVQTQPATTTETPAKPAKPPATTTKAPAKPARAPGPTTKPIATAKKAPSKAPSKALSKAPAKAPTKTPARTAKAPTGPVGPKAKAQPTKS